MTALEGRVSGVEGHTASLEDQEGALADAASALAGRLDALDPGLYSPWASVNAEGGSVSFGRSRARRV